MDYNERKYVILAVVSYLGEATASDVYKELDRDDYVSLSAVQMALLRYYRQGLLARSEGKEKVYWLTSRGEERLDWLKETDQENNEE